MAQIIVCDNCGKQVPDPGTMGIPEWWILRRSDFRGPSRSVCSLDCLVTMSANLKVEADFMKMVEGSNS